MEVEINLIVLYVIYLVIEVVEKQYHFISSSFLTQIKVVTVDTKECTVLVGDSGAPCGPLNEPGGICVHPSGQWLYIADTNNHCVKVYDFDTALLTQVRLRFRCTVSQWGCVSTARRTSSYVITSDCY